jgi:hypothetical protein
MSNFLNIAIDSVDSQSFLKCELYDLFEYVPNGKVVFFVYIKYYEELQFMKWFGMLKTIGINC